MAEHGLAGPVIGVSLDGTGYGSDGAVWGGEFLFGGYREFRRAGHLRYVGMPGGEQAIREPWRMAVAHLLDAGVELPAFTARLSPLALGTIQRMLERGVNSPPTSSAGRLFDAVAALIGIRDRVSYEGQAAVELEWRAGNTAPAASYPFSISKDKDAWVVDTRPLIAALAEEVRRGVTPECIARRFHTTMANVVLDMCRRIRTETGCGDVTLSGGVFQNALLTIECSQLLQDAGFRVCRHKLVPPNDGGLSLGQLAIAAQTLAA
jgi:hydrogenase maturation protein HypF